MGPEERKAKDGWDKADIVGKLLTGVALGLLTLTIKFGADKIQQGEERVAASQKKGQLVQSLVSDLAKPDGGMRQDIAMIALDSSIGGDDPALILDIAEQIVRNRPKEQNAPQFASIVAFEIIERRDKNRAEKIKKALIDNITAGPDPRGSFISGADASKPPERPPAADAKLISTVFPTIVYLQFQGDLRRELMEEFRKSLTDQGLPAPGVQRVAGKYSSSVRYFGEEDHEEARKLAAMATNFFQSKGCPAEFQLSDLAGTQFKAEKGHFEIWVSLSCNK